MEGRYDETAAGTSRMYTPRTPRTRTRFGLGSRNTGFEDEFNDSEAFDELLKQTWSIWAASPLFGSQFNDDVRLKQYAKKLREEIACNLTEESVSYNATFAVMEEMAPRPLATDPPILKIEISSKTLENGTKEKVIYKGFLISWRTGMKLHENCTQLPLLLCRGRTLVLKTVHGVLCNMFDCMVVPLSVTQEDLLWLIAIILNEVKSDAKSKKKYDDDVRLEYGDPDLPITDCITIRYRHSDMILLWKTVSESDGTGDESKIDRKHVDKFFEAFYKHMLTISGLQLRYAILRKISMTSFTIMGNKMKITDKEILNKVLLFLNQRAAEVLHNLEPIHRMDVDSPT